MNNEEFLKIRKQIDLEFVTTPDNFKEQLRQAPLRATKYQHVYIQEKRILDSLKIKLKKIYKELYKHYRWDNDYQLDTKKEIEIYIEGDDKYLDILSDYQEHEIRVKYFEEQIKLFRSMSFWYNVYVKYLELQEGNC